MIELGNIENLPGEETMRAKKQTGNSEPLLTTVARKLGHAAGTLTKATHELTSGVSALPGKTRAKVEEVLDAQKKKSPARQTSSGVRPKRARKKSSSRPAKKRRAKRVPRIAKKH